VKIWVVMVRRASGEWIPVHVERQLVTATQWMDARFAGTVFQRRVQPGTVRR